jgi:hypothetical protein
MAKGGGGSRGGSGSRGGGASRTINATRINPNTPISDRIAARTTTDLGAPRTSRSAGLER